MAFLSLFVLFTVQTIQARNIIDLAGKWNVQLDKNNGLVQKHPEQCTIEGSIDLPASLAEKGYGFKTTGSDFGILTPEYKYVGKASYSRTIEIPENWANKEIEIFLERVLWESRIFIDGKELSKADALGTPHVHRVGELSPGKHKLLVQVDNEMIHNIGDKGHAYSDYTQSIWNGIVGRMEMRAIENTSIEKVNIYPDVTKGQLEIKFLANAKNNLDATVQFRIESLETGETVLSGKKDFKLLKNENGLSFTIPTNKKLKKWSEFTPNVYILKMELTANGNTDYSETEFGFCQVSHNGTKLLVNGNPVFLRGNLDCVHFPVTGYASCNLDDWLRIFKIYKDYGLNHARFHSWCPPEAAFKAANRMGIYLQAEASIWIDWWMSTDMVAQGRPEMDTKGHPKGLGFDQVRDSFVVAEMKRVVETYGNHPSFTLFCIGNELGNSDFEVMKTWVADLKKNDPRRLYAVSTARKITDVDEYCATHYIPEVGRTRGLNGAHTNWDFEETYSKMNIPIIAHEIGQWPVYPKWAEIEKYKGVLKAHNFEGFKLVAEKNGIADQDVDFARASGALNQLMYKYETESFFRTASCAGVQLLSMQDYQGQGEALIGWLDSHWDSKGIATPEKFREHFNTTVPLLRMDKFVWTNNETFEAKAQISHHGNAPLTGACIWKISNEKGISLAEGTFGEKTFGLGTLTDLGAINHKLDKIEKAGKLTVSIEVQGTGFRNDWDIWVYPPETEKVNVDDILIVNKLDEKAKSALEKGGKVFLMAGELGTEETSVNVNFYPLYWSLTFFPGQGKTCIGTLLNDKHPAFNDFPTAYHSDWQWQTISDKSKGFILNGLPHSYKPIAQPIDDFHRNNKVGAIFEVKVGAGSLLVCGFNLDENLPVARQLKTSLLKYMKMIEFAPKQQVDYRWLQKIFQEIPKAESTDVPDEFKNAVLYVDAAAKAKTENTNIPWNAEIDEVKVAEKTTYQLNADGVWKEGGVTAWHGAEIQLQINCPEGMLGTLYVRFSDSNNKGRTGLLDFEGRKEKLGLHPGDGIWVKFHVMREDSNDGKLTLKTKAGTGGNLMMTDVVLVKE
jgi:hypothetical protein